jgi:hypothetical protein
MYRHPVQHPPHHQAEQPTTRRKVLPKYRYIIASLLVMCTIMLATTVGTTLWSSGHSAKASAGTYTGLTNLGMPSSPQIFNPSDYAITLHYRDPMQQGGRPTPMMADHGADCAPPLAQHQTGSSFQDGVFICHDHVMTATNSNDSGYSNIYVQPPAMLDWSSGTATLDISMSTFRTAARDWVDFWFTPFDRQSPNPDVNVPDGQGPPVNSLHIEMATDNNSRFIGEYFVNGTEHDLAARDLNLHNVLKPSKTVRTPFEFQISSSHVRFGISSLNAWFVDAPANLNFTQGIFQFGHHSYTPYKQGSDAPPEQLALGKGAEPDTWHWSNLVMSPAVPITIINPTPASEPDHLCESCTLTFPTGAPANAFIRYRGVQLNPVLLSFDGGKTWVNGQTIAGETHDCCHIENYWQPIPAGTTSVKARGLVRDVIVTAASSTTQLPPAGSMPTPVPTTISAIDMRNTPCMITVNGVMVNGTCTGTFIPAK